MRWAAFSVLLMACGGGVLGPGVGAEDPGYGLALLDGDPQLAATRLPSCGTTWLDPPFVARSGAGFPASFRTAMNDVRVYATVVGPGETAATVVAASTDSWQAQVDVQGDGEYRLCVQCVRQERVVGADCSDTWVVDNVPPPPPRNLRWRPQ